VLSTAAHALAQAGTLTEAQLGDVASAALAALQVASDVAVSRHWGIYGKLSDWPPRHEEAEAEGAGARCLCQRPHAEAPSAALSAAHSFFASAAATSSASPSTAALFAKSPPQRRRPGVPAHNLPNRYSIAAGASSPLRGGGAAVVGTVGGGGGLASPSASSSTSLESIGLSNLAAKIRGGVASPPARSLTARPSLFDAPSSLSSPSSSEGAVRGGGGAGALPKR